MAFLPGMFMLAAGSMAELSAQNKVHDLDTVQVSAMRLTTAPAGQTTDSLQLFNEIFARNMSVADLLYFNSLGLIRQQGPGLLATFSNRGGSAAQSVVLWEGFVLNSPMHGQVDYNLLPAAFFGGSTLTRGGNSAVNGSGSLTAVVNLQASPAGQPQVYADISAGSFGTRQILTGMKSRRGEVNVLYRAAKNEFTFQNPAKGNATEQQAHAGQRMLHANGNVQRQFGKYHVKAAFWISGAFREIPKTFTEAKSEATQEDAAARGALTVRRNFGDWAMQFRQGFFYDELKFKDPLRFIDAAHRSASATTELEAGKTVFKNKKLVLGVLANYGQMHSKDYHPNEIWFHRYAVQGQLSGANHHWRWNLNARAESNEGQPMQPSGNAGVERIAGKNVLKIYLASNYRFPTFNDRYWMPGGNPDINPERGYAAEVGWQRGWGQSAQKPTSNFIFFGNHFHNRIMWQSEGGYWSVINLTNLRSAGVELNLKWPFKLGSWLAEANGGLTLTNIWEVDERGVAVRAAAIPADQGFINFSLQKRSLSFLLNYRYNGMQIFSLSGGSTVPAFTTLHGRIAYTPHAIRGLDIYAGIENMLNAQYMMVPMRPMPGINFNAGLRLTLSYFTKNQPHTK